MFLWGGLEPGQQTVVLNASWPGWDWLHSGGHNCTPLPATSCHSRSAPREAGMEKERKALDRFMCHVPYPFSSYRPLRARGEKLSPERPRKFRWIFVAPRGRRIEAESRAFALPYVSVEIRSSDLTIPLRHRFLSHNADKLFYRLLHFTASRRYKRLLRKGNRNNSVGRRPVSIVQ